VDRKETGDTMVNTAKKIYTIDDWSNLPNEERCELIEGDLVYKTLPSADHSYSQNAITTIITSEYHYKRKGPKGWWIGTEISVAYGERRVNGFIHDLAGWKKENYPEKPRGKKVLERPDWVCEILSSNKKNDLDTKKWVLHEHKVPFYWIVDLELEMIFVLEWAEKGYTIIVDACKDQKRILPPFDMEFNVSMLLGNNSD
jgi:Uma2 family endonuclease